MKSHNTFSRFLEGLILAALLLFISSAGFQDKSKQKRIENNDVFEINFMYKFNK